MQITQIFSQDAQYPALLKEISSPPKSIYALGEIPTSPMVAIVGTRNCTPYGKTVAYQLAGELARAGVVIVSGLAYGIDSIAHEAALEAGGKTVAVLANGLNRIYPAAHRDLARDILAKGGAIISEYPVGTPPYPGQFPARNRIVVGLSLGVIVIESGAEGGSMITASRAVAENRVVMAVPGDIRREASAGTNNLIHSGAATAVTCAQHVYEALEMPPELIPATEIYSARSPHEAKVLELLAVGVNSSAELSEASGLSAAEFATVISLMEITGKIRNLGGGVWAPRSAKRQPVKTPAK